MYIHMHADRETEIRTSMHMHTHTHTHTHTHRASVQSRLFEAEEDADSNKALVVQLKGEIKELKQKLVRADNTRRKLHNELQELKGNIRVYCRVRPLSSAEKQHDSPRCGRAQARKPQHAADVRTLCTASDAL